MTSAQPVPAVAPGHETVLRCGCRAAAPDNSRGCVRRRGHTGPCVVEDISASLGMAKFRCRDDESVPHD